MTQLPRRGEQRRAELDMKVESCVACDEAAVKLKADMSRWALADAADYPLRRVLPPPVRAAASKTLRCSARLLKMLKATFSFATRSRVAIYFQVIADADALARQKVSLKAYTVATQIGHCHWMCEGSLVDDAFAFASPIRHVLFNDVLSQYHDVASALNAHATVSVHCVNLCWDREDMSKASVASMDVVVADVGMHCMCRAASSAVDDALAAPDVEDIVQSWVAGPSRDADDDDDDMQCDDVPDAGPGQPGLPLPRMPETLTPDERRVWDHFPIESAQELRDNIDAGNADEPADQADSDDGGPPQADATFDMATFTREWVDTFARSCQVFADCQEFSAQSPVKGCASLCSYEDEVFFVHWDDVAKGEGRRVTIELNEHSGVTYMCYTATTARAMFDDTLVVHFNTLSLHMRRALFNARTAVPPALLRLRDVWRKLNGVHTTYGQRQPCYRCKSGMQDDIGLCALCGHWWHDECVETVKDEMVKGPWPGCDARDVKPSLEQRGTRNVCLLCLYSVNRV